MAPYLALGSKSVCDALEKDYVKAALSLKRRHATELRSLAQAALRGGFLDDGMYVYTPGGATPESPYTDARDTLIAKHDAEFAALHAYHRPAVDLAYKCYGARQK